MPIEILKKESPIYEKLKNMSNEDYFKTVVSHAIKETYSKLVEQVKTYNTNSLGIYNMNLFIPTLLNKMVIDYAGFDISSNYNAVMIEDHIVPERAKYQLMEQMLEVKVSGGFTSYSAIAIAAMQRSGWYFNAEDIIIHSLIDIYRVSQRRIDSIMTYEPAQEAHCKATELKKDLESKEQKNYNLLKFSVGFAQTFGYLRYLLEENKPPHLYILSISKNNEYTKIEINANLNNEITLIFNEKNIAIFEETKYDFSIAKSTESFEDVNKYSIMEFDSTKTFNIRNQSYELSLDGIKVLEMENIGNVKFKISGNINY